MKRLENAELLDYFILKAAERMTASGFAEYLNAKAEILRRLEDREDDGK